ncbi:MAG: UDP-N-acetylmuramoyl-L-alanine--D-glutamate ligase, partial [Muribaculaceae bacterium]|nr:UDP-N-acetylmuramoyl-L-alanine--D-glutamate ligase [Muribaculaceae bacterium]
ILMNITPDHLDRYDHRMELYADSKLRITRNQRATDAFIYWQEDPVSMQTIERTDIGATRLPFGVKRTLESAAWLEGDVMQIATSGSAWSMPRAEMSLKGLHNLYNSMAAAIAATRMGVEPKLIREALASFKAVEHRLEHVAEIDGVQYINDSKATNVASTYYALESMTRPTVLILGGTDKGNDYTEILTFMKQKVRSVVAMGADNRKIVDFCRTHGFEVADTSSLADALQACRAAARPGDTVLLSPCCASFDLFKSYIDRGQRFKEAVLAQL